MWGEGASKQAAEKSRPHTRSSTFCSISKLEKKEEILYWCYYFSCHDSLPHLTSISDSQNHYLQSTWSQKLLRTNNTFDPLIFKHSFWPRVTCWSRIYKYVGWLDNYWPICRPQRTLTFWVNETFLYSYQQNPLSNDLTKIDQVSFSLVQMDFPN